MIYHLTASKGDESIADAHGDIDLIAYVARKLKVAMDGTPDAEYSVRLSEVATYGAEDVKRVLVDVDRQDAEVALYLLNKKIRKERSAAA